MSANPEKPPTRAEIKRARRAKMRRHEQAIYQQALRQQALDQQDRDQKIDQQARESFDLLLDQQDRDQKIDQQARDQQAPDPKALGQKALAHLGLDQLGDAQKTLDQLVEAADPKTRRLLYVIGLFEQPYEDYSYGASTPDTIFMHNLRNNLYDTLLALRRFATKNGFIADEDALANNPILTKEHLDRLPKIIGMTDIRVVLKIAQLRLEKLTSTCDREKEMYNLDKEMTICYSRMLEDRWKKILHENMDRTTATMEEIASITTASLRSIDVRRSWQ